MQYGRAVLVDFYKTNHPCTCIVTPSFAGELLVTLRRVTNVCHTQVNVQDRAIFKCPLLSFTSHTLNVQINQAVEVRAEYALPSTSGTFYYCVGFQQNGKYVYTSILHIIIIWLINSQLSDLLNYNIIEQNLKNHYVIK